LNPDDSINAFFSFCHYSVPEHSQLKQSFLRSGFIYFFLSVIASHLSPPLHFEVLRYARESTGEYASIVGDIFEALKGGVGAKYRFSAGNSSSALEIWRGVLDVFEKCPEVYDWRILGLSEDGIEDLDDNEEVSVEFLDGQKLMCILTN